MPRRTIAAVAALAFALILAGCSGNDEPTTPKASLQATLTRTDTQLSWQWTLTNDDSNPIVILDGPNSILQTTYFEEHDELVAIAFDELSGKIAAASASTVHVYKPYGRDEGELRWSVWCTCARE